ncbi:MAG: dTDP-4-dehydrorhamnose 3,5-epimerase [Rhizobacter sp.]|nr:dTDP-4-dehydrorhamnose 3,5-epimerase [Ferruginibacter sp.]
MEFIKTNIEGVYLVKLKRLDDERGLFARTYCKNEFQNIGFDKEFVQFNHSYNRYKGTLRGMHFQNAPYTETKLIRCVQGAVLDVAVDIREGSATFLQHISATLSADNMMSIIIPEGVAHGFQTLEDDSALIYHHTQFYTAGADNGLRYDDPALSINWPLPVTQVSEKDKQYNLIENNFKGIKI